MGYAADKELALSSESRPDYSGGKSVLLLCLSYVRHSIARKSSKRQNVKASCRGSKTLQSIKINHQWRMSLGELKLFAVNGRFIRHVSSSALRFKTNLF